MNNLSGNQATLASAYLDYFSLNCPPFSEEPDPRFFYSAQTLSQRLDLLTHLTQFGDSIVIVAGPEGSGKTTLLDHFARRMNSGWTIARFEASDIDDFRQALAARLEGGSDLSVKEILTDWMNRSQTSDLLVVMIDDAEELSEAAISNLAALFDPAVTNRTRLVLFGTSKTSNLVKRAQEEGLFRGSTQLLEMPRLSDEDTASYLMYRLAVAGYSGESPFSPTQVSAISKASDGRPAGINRLADQCLVEKYEQAASRPGGHPGSVIQRIVPVIAVTLAVAVFGGLWQILSRDTNNPPETPSLEPVIADRAASPAPETVATADELQDADPIEFQTGTTESTPAEDIASVSMSATNAETPTTAEPARAAAATSESIAAAPAVPAAEGVNPESESTTPVAVPAVESPVATTVSALEMKSSSPAATPEPPTDSLARREAWLEAQDPSSYTLQLLGSRNESAARQFIEKLRLSPEKVSYYRGIYKGGDWYVVLYGVYPSRSAATADITNLPAALQEAKPWPRPLKSVHEAIQATHIR